MSGEALEALANTTSIMGGVGVEGEEEAEDAVVLAAPVEAEVTDMEDEVLDVVAEEEATEPGGISVIGFTQMMNGIHYHEMTDNGFSVYAKSVQEGVLKIVMSPQQLPQLNPQPHKHPHPRLTTGTTRPSHEESNVAQGPEIRLIAPFQQYLVAYPH
jgi:protoporphyrinogen oxidase